MSHPVHIEINEKQRHPKVNSKEYIAHSYEPSDDIFLYAPKKPIAMLLKQIGSSRQRFRLIAQRLRSKKL